MSDQGMLRYLESRPVVVPPKEWEHHFGVLLADSKGFQLKRVHDNNIVPMEFLCKAGAGTEALFQLLREELPKLIQKHGKFATIYVWSGTCDFTEKIRHTRMIRVRSNASCVPARTLQLYEQMRTYAFHQGCNIKFIGCPFYSVSIYNGKKGGTDRARDAEADAEVKRLVTELNEGIVVLNNQYDRNTLQFNADLTRTRGIHRNHGVRRARTAPHGRVTIMWLRLYDGIHPGNLLSKVWLRRILLDVVRECYQDPGSLQLRADAQEVACL